MPRLIFWQPAPVHVVELHGVLASREGALNLKSVGPAVERAFRGLNKRGGDVVLDINSPGGSPVQSELIGSLIRRRAEEAKARVHAVIQDVGASGGYWLACAADQIHASALSIVGSIGVIGGGFGVTDLMQRIGVERRLYTAGQNKARLDPFSPERPEDVDFAKRVMADIHEGFKDWVRTRRAGRLRGDEAAIFDGSFMLGRHALELGLIDQFNDLDGVVRAIGGPKAQPKVFRPVRRRGLLALLPRRAAQTFVDAALDAVEARRFQIRI
jgi:signal peptide peptidase SppA